MDPQYPDFGLRDLRAKGATDMYRADRGGNHKIQAHARSLRFGDKFEDHFSLSPFVSSPSSSP